MEVMWSFTSLDFEKIVKPTLSAGNPPLIQALKEL